MKLYYSNYRILGRDAIVVCSSHTFRGNGRFHLQGQKAKQVNFNMQAMHSSQMSLRYHTARRHVPK
jgi:hypothetical protein